jgi:hypothetical protein
MTSTQVEPLTELYEADETAWLEAMAQLAARRAAAELDYEHLAESSPTWRSAIVGKSRVG